MSFSLFQGFYYIFCRVKVDQLDHDAEHSDSPADVSISLKQQLVLWNSDDRNE